MLIILFLSLSVSAVNAQDEGFIYGRVTTIDDNVYEGPIRWDDEECYWTDMFNASKEENEYLDYLSRDEMDYLEESKRDRWSGNSWVKVNWGDWDWDEDYVHQFSVQFGELKSLKPFSRSSVDVELQNGMVVEVDGDGYNDIGSDVVVKDPELGEIDLNWGRIDKIEFLPTPKKLDNKFGKPLYGTVETDFGEFTGFVQWDHDERVSTDKLDGDTYDGDVSIDFGKIKSIERYGSSRSIVVLQSGRELELRGSNDVNDENRGVIVTVEGLGRVDVNWDDFEKVTFTNAPGSGRSYKDFSSQNKIKGTVQTTEGTSHSGEIVFDLDEAYDFEVLHGKEDDSEFIIPFRNIRNIRPRNYEYSRVVLKNGDELMLGDSQDVSDRNEGILVFEGRDPIYIPWKKVDEINID